MILNKQYLTHVLNALEAHRNMHVCLRLTLSEIVSLLETSQLGQQMQGIGQN